MNHADLDQLLILQEKDVRISKLRKELASLPEQRTRLLRQMEAIKQKALAAKQEVAQMKMLGMRCKAALDVEQAAEYAILVCQMLENGAPVNKLHYVLMKKSCDREPLILNPWHGEALPPAQPLIPGASVEPSLVWTGAAIEILLPG